jgi:hypothetical protein
MAFNTLIAIQSSAFLMTLFRKSLIPYSVHGIGYTFCLVVSGFHIFRTHSSPYFAVGVLAVFLSRITWGINKYTLWTIFALCAAMPELIEIAYKNQLAKNMDDSGFAPFNVTEAAGLGQQYIDLGQQYLSAISV